MGYKPDLLMIGNPATDEFSHMFLGLTVPQVSGLANPYYNNYFSYGELITPDIAEGFIREAYTEADATLALGKELMALTPPSSPPPTRLRLQWLAVNAGKVLFDAGLQAAAARPRRKCSATARRHGHRRVQPGQGVLGGGTAQIYINLAGRDPAGTTSQPDLNKPQVPLQTTK